MEQIRTGDHEAPRAAGMAARLWPSFCLDALHPHKGRGGEHPSAIRGMMVQQEGSGPDQSPNQSGIGARQQLPGPGAAETAISPWRATRVQDASRIAWEELMTFKGSQ